MKIKTLMTTLLIAAATTGANAQAQKSTTINASILSLQNCRKTRMLRVLLNRN